MQAITSVNSLVTVRLRVLSSRLFKEPTADHRDKELDYSTACWGLLFPASYYCYGAAPAADIIRVSGPGCRLIPNRFPDHDRQPDPSPGPGPRPSPNLTFRLVGGVTSHSWALPVALPRPGPLTRSHSAVPCRQFRAVPCRAVPCRAVPCRASDCVLFGSRVAIALVYTAEPGGR